MYAQGPFLETLAILYEAEGEHEDGTSLWR